MPVNNSLQAWLSPARVYLRLFDKILPNIQLPSFLSLFIKFMNSYWALTFTSSHQPDNELSAADLHPKKLADGCLAPKDHSNNRRYVQRDYLNNGSLILSFSTAGRQYSNNWHPLTSLIPSSLIVGGHTSNNRPLFSSSATFFSLVGGHHGNNCSVSTLLELSSFIATSKSNNHCLPLFSLLLSLFSTSKHHIIFFH